MKLSAKAVKLATAAGAMIAIMSLAFSFQTTSQAAGADDGPALYKAKCAMCHAADGSGNTPVGKSMKLRDLRSAEVQGQSDGVLLEIIAGGKNKMPAYEKSLGADKCKGLVSFIRALRPQP